MSEWDEKAYLSLVKRKDSTGDFYFLRRLPVDVLRYLPHFLAKDPEFKKIQDALSWEHENLRLRLMDVSRQFYIETATWGLSSWERIYQTNPPTGAGYVLRRALVKAKMLGTGVMTVETIKHLCNAFLDKQDAEIDELPEPGTFYLITHSGMAYLNEIIRVLSEMSPAHLLFGFRFIRNVDSVTGIDALPSLHRQYVAGPKPAESADVSATVYCGGVLSEHRQYVASQKPAESGVLSAHKRIAAKPRLVQHNEARATPSMGGKAGMHIRITGGVMKHG